MTTTSIILILAFLLIIGVVRLTREGRAKEDQPQPMQNEIPESSDPQPEFNSSWVEESEIKTLDSKTEESPVE